MTTAASTGLGLRRWSPAVVVRYPVISSVVIVGIVVRAILVPITHGQDFVVWDKASAATLHGVNIYAHHPDYPGGPYAYFPLFLYVELPFQWLAQHSAIPFTVLGKLPIMAADLLAAAVLGRMLIARGLSDARAGLLLALFFLNPLVLYNGAFYGRFDSLGCALLLVALWFARPSGELTGRATLWYCLAVAAKTFPLFMALALLRRGRRTAGRVIVALVLVLGGLSLPYLGALRPYLHDIVLYDAQKVPQGLSWQQLLLHVTSPDAARVLSYFFLLAFVVVALALLLTPGLTDRAGAVDLVAYPALVLLAFILFSKVVLEQYLVWPMPWLVMLIAMGWHRRLTAALLTLLTAIGILVNPHIHPFGRSPEWVAAVLGCALAGYLIFVVRKRRAEGP